MNFKCAFPFPTLLFLLVTIPGLAQPAADEVTLAQVAKAAKVYFHDSAEFPLRMKVEMTFTDLAGHVRKHQTGKYDYYFNGYNVRSQGGRGDLKGFRSNWRSRGTLRAARATAFAPMLLIEFFMPDTGGGAIFTVREGSAPGMLAAVLKPIGSCDPFQWLKEYYSAESFCGVVEAQLRKDDLELKGFSFDALGLPVPATIDTFGNATILRYHSNGEFQKIFLPGDPKPFLVPRLVTVTVETDKGKLVMSSVFTLRK